MILSLRSRQRRPEATRFSALLMLLACFIGGCGGGVSAQLSLGSSDSPSPSPIANYENVRSTISGEFDGWSGDTVFVLDNGQVWQQSSYSYVYHYAYRPCVLIYGTYGDWKMKVEGVDEVISVVRLQ